MGTPQKILLPPPNFNNKMSAPVTMKPHFLTSSGMTLHARHQPPPMYGKRGATYPGKFLQTTANKYSSSVVPEPEMAVSQFCEACDMELQSVSDLRRHKAQHEKCPVDNCNYRGHPSVMDKHVATLHSSGLFDKFKKLSSPEEIAAWREERKQKYPTLENSLMRQRAREQREKRGERLENSKSRFGKYDDRKRAQNNSGCSDKNQRGKPNQHQNCKPRTGNEHNRRNNNKRRRKDQKNLEEKKQNVEIEKIKGTKKEKELTMEESRDENDSSYDGVFMFKGTRGLTNYQHFKPKKSKEKNVLTGLLGMYGSDEDSESDNEDEMLTESEEVSLDCPELKVETTRTEKSLDCTAELVESSNFPTLEMHLDKKQLNIEIKNCLITEPEKIIEASENSTFEVHSNTNHSENFEDAKSPNTDIDPIKRLNHSNESITLHTLNEGEEFVCSDDEAPEEVPIQRTTDLPMPTQTEKPIENTTNNASNRLPPGKRTKANQPSRIQKSKSGLDYRKIHLRKQNTLLEKLLAPDIRHERNVLLQCVRYVCENNFFGIGEKRED
ncbi:FMR1-interacting protein NUFIP1 [Anastrepha ludens]|uniref:FMR1-interacting protein NUFIP1 n=1 Tax=Anastrepha ludens TaxID=28586 RepID=UPI0023AF2C9F|nr:FMR1-interacting protein NUFIP1 [Anastrepha ludens]